MNELQKILVVDNGERAAESGLSAELAGMGFASVTAPFEAADEVLAMMPSPGAIVLQVPQRADFSERRRFMELASRLRRSLPSSGVPVIVAAGVAGIAPLLETALGVKAIGL
ncbi:hypothetical protein [Microvirga terricola]|uniref:Response regulatory domain-containing protein n=1 Tax=Microvirga terricola TaxID=2719797 RepID=A0ABX0VCJ1_9HYPH|nr:hypothetical protein [Microvirga terricola]NIX77560.1 hypothetical protein [Microvirga terricola]